MATTKRLIAWHLCTVRKLLIDAKYYQNDRASWEKDDSGKFLFLAKANLDEAERLLEKLEGEAYG